MLGVDVGDSEDEVFWTAFLRGLKNRGLGGVRLVIFDAHAGLKASIPHVLAGASWQRCKVHLMRNTLGMVPPASKDMAAATVRTIFAQPSADAVGPNRTRSSGSWKASSPRPPPSWKR